MTSLGPAQKSVLATPAQNAASKESRCSRMGNNSLSALLWKRKKEEVRLQAYPSPEWSRWEWEAAVPGLHIPDLPTLCQNATDFDKNISWFALFLQDCFHRSWVSFCLVLIYFQKFYQEEDLTDLSSSLKNTTPSVLSFQLYWINFTNGKFYWNLEGQGWVFSAFSLRFQSTESVDWIISDTSKSA